MAKKPVLELECSRCGAKEYLDYTPPETGSEEEEEKDVPELVIIFEGETYQFDELCSKCKKTVRTYIQSAVKDIKASRERMAKKRNPGQGSSS